MQYLFLVFIFVIAYFLLVRPQQQQARRQRSLVSSLEVGSEVQTAGGIVGRITDMDDEFVQLQVGPGTTITFIRAAVQKVISSPDFGPADDLDLTDPDHGLDLGQTPDGLASPLDGRDSTARATPAADAGPEPAAPTAAGSDSGAPAPPAAGPDAGAPASSAGGPDAGGSASPAAGVPTVVSPAPPPAGALPVNPPADAAPPPSWSGTDRGAADADGPETGEADAPS